MQCVWLYVLCLFCLHLDGVFIMVLRFSVGDHYEGLAPLISDLHVAFEAYQGQVPDRLSFTDTDESVVMLTYNS